MDFEERYRAMETKAAASVAREMGDFVALMTAR